MSKHREISQLSKETLALLQNPKTPVSILVRQLEIIGTLSGNEELMLWCDFQFGKYRGALPTYSSGDDVEAFKILLDSKVKNSELEAVWDDIKDRVYESGGGFRSIEVIEEMLAGLDKKKASTHGRLNRNNLLEAISSIRNSVSKRVTKIYATYAFGELPSQHFDIIRERVDDLLLEICPEAVEKFMTAYNNLSSQSKEDWSLALTCCRRVIKSVADALYPPQNVAHNGRSVGEEQYINRLWAFLDKHAKSSSEKVLAKAHVDYLGSFLERLNEKACKGVHATVSHEEAIKAVLYTYLTLGDILEFAPKALTESISKSTGRVNINTATLSQMIESGISSAAAKEIIKFRVRKKFKTLEDLQQVKGIGNATFNKIRNKFIAISDSV